MDVADRQKLRDDRDWGLTQWLRKRGEWVGREPISDEVLDRWLDSAGIEGRSLEAFDWMQVAKDLQSWYEGRKRGTRQFVLHGPQLEYTSETPAWWRVYERTVEDRVREPFSREIPQMLEERDDWVARRKDIERVKDLVMYYTGTDAQGAYAFLRGEPLRIPPAIARVQYGAGAPRLELTISSPLLEVGMIAELFERSAGPLREGYQAPPPDIKERSAEFYLAYEDLMRQGIRDKAQRLEALPDDLRGDRNPNSAAAYFSKLKKQFRLAFTYDESWIQIPEQNRPSLDEVKADFSDEAWRRQIDEINELHRQISETWKGGETL